LIVFEKSVICNRFFGYKQPKKPNLAKAEPSELQRFFLTHPEINVGQFALKAGINAGLLRNYINGFKKPSQEREAQILRQIHQLGQEFAAVTF
jgi:hypothetical protein